MYKFVLVIIQTAKMTFKGLPSEDNYVQRRSVKCVTSRIGVGTCAILVTSDMGRGRGGGCELIKKYGILLA